MKSRSAWATLPGFLSAIVFCGAPALGQPYENALPEHAGAAYGDDPEDGAEAPPETGAVYARLKHFEGGISIRREDEAAGGPSQLAINAPLIPGDQVWTGEDGRSEIQLADGTILRLDTNARLSLQNLADREATFDNTTLLRLQNGSLYIRADGFDPRSRRFQVDTPAGSVFLLSGGVFRIDVAPGGLTTVASYRGVAEALAEEMSVMAHSGERVTVVPGRAPAEARAFNTLRRDPFHVWSEQRDDDLAYPYADASRGPRPEVPEPVRPYVSELSRYGVWRHDPTYGWIWVPDDQPDDWRPYYYGHWVYAPIGPTWVSYEPWGWAPYHYGRWEWVVGVGWFWAPGYVFSGAYVSWAVGPAWYGWIPLGYYNYPVYYGHYHPWVFVNHTHIYYSHVHRHSLSWSDVARRRLLDNSYVVRGHPVPRPGYSLEGRGSASYRRALASPGRMTAGAVKEAGQKRPFRDADQMGYRRALARRASPEPGGPAAGLKAGPGGKSGPSRPGYAAPRPPAGGPGAAAPRSWSGSAGRSGGSGSPAAGRGGAAQRPAAGQPGWSGRATTGAKVTPVAMRAGGATGATGAKPGVSPATGRPMQPPVRVLPPDPGVGRPGEDRPAGWAGRDEDGTPPSERRSTIRSGSRTPAGTVSRPGAAARTPSSPRAWAPAHPRSVPERPGATSTRSGIRPPGAPAAPPSRVQPPRPGGGSRVFVMPRGSGGGPPPKAAPSGGAPARPAPAAKPGGGHKGGGGGKKGGKD
jgi:hypothetical protein